MPLDELLPPSVPPDALDLLKGLLVFNPDKRLTAEQALQHPYVARYRGSTDSFINRLLWSGVLYSEFLTIFKNKLFCVVKAVILRWAVLIISSV